MSVSFECKDCGACCLNPAENRREGRSDYVPIEPSAPLRSRRDLLRKVAVEDAAGVLHLRMASDGRCVALRGAPGRRVSCAIYHVRPRACRTVQPGDADCLRARSEWLRPAAAASDSGRA